MVKINSVDRMLIKMNLSGEYNTYYCEAHGIYQTRKDLTPEYHVCPYCKRINSELSEKEIQEYLK